LKDSISGTYRLKTEEQTKNGEESSRNRSQKRFISVTEAPQLGFFSRKQFSSLILRESSNTSDAILPRKGPVTRAMSKRIEEDWARAAEEGPRVLMNLRVDF